ncbi:MAG: arsenate reductase (glutaredoxin) [Alphaproteobacteria bacterium]|nr:MAG: arsenate reductase (glutaredoxin) [Alphaproteobacteria bacterium]
MNKTILIHNPRCSKSREAQKILIELGVEFEVIDYLKDGLKEKLLTHLPKLLGLTFKEMIREKETLYKELDLAGKENMSDIEWVNILKNHPILLERPLFIHNNKAIIARPPELVRSIL